MDLRDLIEYENENTNLDFKTIPYKKEMFSEMLKDIIAMANADTRDDRFIIFGVKHYPDGRRDVLGVDDFMDDASYQKFVNDNVEPELFFEYSTIEVSGKKLAYFRIYNCADQPYMLKKDYPPFKRGESFVRKGSFQTRLVRRDIDRMFLGKYKSYDFDSFVSVDADYSSNRKALLFESKEFILPSQDARERITNIIKRKEEEQENAARIEKRIKEGPFAGLAESLNGVKALSLVDNFDNPYGPYESRNLNTLRNDLERVAESYREYDAYSVFEEQSNKLNFKINNKGEKYIEDVSLELTIHGDFNFIIATKKYTEPSSVGPTFHSPNWEGFDYPMVTEGNNNYVIHSTLGQLKHGISSLAFKMPLSIFLPIGSAGKKLMIDVKIFGANIPSYIVKSFEIDVF